uniref:Uncharacterized protein TCIL3000_4_300 n=1 Tax=Trypanosoma congolense (strain IL3000) TaxID=1068625 RepID=G0UKP3_TRYCI|nr:unnamed protein product [Trypanosoma congolense IL3000]
MLRLFSVQCLPTLRRGALLPLWRSCHVAPLGDTQRLGGVVSHSKLLRKVLQGSDPDYVKGRRIRGTVRKIEGSYMNWLGQCGQGECLMMLSSLAMSARFLERREHGASGFNCDDEWSGVSPFFSPGVNDWLCALLQRCASQVESPEECMQLLSFAVDLELGDTQTLQKLCHKVTAKDYIASASPEKLVGVLRLLSLLVKRCRMPVPPLDKLLCRLIGATLDSRQALTVLSSMLRLRERKSVDVVQSVSRKAADMVLTYTAKDVIYALEAVALLNCCHEAYAGAVLRRCCVLCPTLTSGELGSVCKYVALLNTTRTSNTIAFSCAQELRRLLPAILNRAELLLGKFSLRDARCVLRCLKQHNVHHAIVFSRLTPLITDGVK